MIGTDEEVPAFEVRTETKYSPDHGVTLAL